MHAPSRGRLLLDVNKGDRKDVSEKAAEASAAAASTDVSEKAAQVNAAEASERAAVASAAKACATDAAEHDSTPSSASTSSSSVLSVLPSDQIGCGTRASPKTVVPPAAPRQGDAAVGLLYDDSMERHIGPEHYERPQRIIRVFESLTNEGLMARCFQLPAREATDEELLRVHPQEHIDKVHRTYDERPDEQRDCAFIQVFGDLYLCADTARAARYAAGCVAEGVEQVLSGSVSSALAVVRPPGHHAECARAMGFCFFNNCAVAARAALAHKGISRVLVLDWDVHHGNGIQDAVWSDPDVLYVSLHRHPKNFYPFTAGFPEEVGDGKGEGFNVNVAWHVKGAGDADYRAAFDLVVEPIVRSFAPDMIIVAAGFDAARGDPLGGCQVTPDGYFEMTRRLMGLAPQGRLVLALEGGYNNSVTAQCAMACVRALLGDDAADSASESGASDAEPVEDFFGGAGGGAAQCANWPLGTTGKALKEVARIQRQYWPALEAGGAFDAAWDAYLEALQGAAAPSSGAAGAVNAAEVCSMRRLSIHSRASSFAPK